MQSETGNVHACGSVTPTSLASFACSCMACASLLRTCKRGLLAERELRWGGRGCLGVAVQCLFMLCAVHNLQARVREIERDVQREREREGGGVVCVCD